MRLASMLAVAVAVAVTVVTAVAAPTAFANLEVSDEAQAEHCTEIEVLGPHSISGGCPLRITGSSSIELIMALSSCDSEYEARLDEEGDGVIYNQALFGSGCMVFPCTESGEPEPWGFQMDATGPGTQHLSIQFCVWGISEPFGVVCTFEAAVDFEGHSSITATANAVPCSENPSLHVTGSWTVQPDGSHPAVEIENLL
jgi:hypothetical protein